MDDLLLIFANWLRTCGEDSFYLFDNTEEAIQRFIVETDIDSHFEVLKYEDDV